MKWRLPVVHLCIPPFSSEEITESEKLSNRLKNGRDNLSKYLHEIYFDQTAHQTISDRDLFGALFCQTHRDLLHPIHCRFDCDTLLYDLTLIVYSGQAIPDTAFPSTVNLKRNIPKNLQSPNLNWYQISHRNCLILELVYKEMISKDHSRDWLYANYDPPYPQCSLAEMKKYEEMGGRINAECNMHTVSESDTFIDRRLKSCYVVDKKISLSSYTRSERLDMMIAQTPVKIPRVLAKMGSLIKYERKREYNPFDKHIVPRESRIDEIRKPAIHYDNSLYMKFDRLAKRKSFLNSEKFCATNGLLHWPVLKNGSTLLNTSPECYNFSLGVLYPVSYFDSYVKLMNVLMDTIADISKGVRGEKRINSVSLLLNAILQVNFLEDGGWVYGSHTRNDIYDQSPLSFICYVRGLPEEPFREDMGNLATNMSLSKSLRELAGSGYIEWDGDSFKEREDRYNGEMVYYYSEFFDKFKTLMKSLADNYDISTLKECIISLRPKLMLNRSSYDSLIDAMIAMLLRDLESITIKRCPHCGNNFISNHNRRVFCPHEDGMTDCSKLSLYQKRKNRC